MGLKALRNSSGDLRVDKSGNIIAVNQSEGGSNLPDITSADIGKYLKVKDDLSLEWAEVQSGGGIPVVDIGTIEEFTSVGPYDSASIDGNSEDFNILLNNDIAFLKFTYGGDIYILPKSTIIYDGENIYIHGLINYYGEETYEFDYKSQGYDSTYPITIIRKTLE